MNLSKLIHWRIQNYLSRGLRKVELIRLKACARKQPKPVIAVTGSVGKTTTCRMLAHVLSAKFGSVGVSGTQGIWIGSERIKSGDRSGSYSALQLIADDRCKVVVGEIARGGLLARGMILDRVDVGVLLNVYDNHLGLDGVHTRKQLGDVKSIVLKKARYCAVINADDAVCMSYYSSIKATRIYLISRDSSNPELERHRRNGGSAVFLDHGVVKLCYGKDEVGSMMAADIPDSHNGSYLPGIISAMNSLAVADSLGVSLDVICDRLKSFHSTVQSNPGRMNQIQESPYDLWVTCADGPEAVKELASFFDQKTCSGRKIIMLAPMGNRSDEFLKGVAAAVVDVFDYFICSDWKDLRGREPKEVARLLASEIGSGEVEQENIHIAQDHAHGLSHTFSKALPGDLVLFVTFSGDDVLTLHEHRSMPDLPSTAVVSA